MSFLGYDLEKIPVMDENKCLRSLKPNALSVKMRMVRTVVLTTVYNTCVLNLVT